MADTKISALTDGTTAEATDRIAVARDPTGTPLSRYITPSYIRTYLLGLANTWTQTQTFADAVIGSSNLLKWSTDLILSRRGAANLRFGDADAAAPVAQTLSVQSVVAGTSNTAGANFTITGSQGTGTGAGGSIIFQTAPAGSSGTAQNALATALTVASDRSATLQGTFVVNDTINFGIGGSLSATIVGVSNLLYFGSDGFVFRTKANANATTVAADAANTLALRNSTNAQTFRVYNTYTDASNYERGFIRWATNVLEIGNEKLGTGSARDFSLISSGSISLNATATLYLFSNATARWQVPQSTGDFLAQADNTYDIGASGANRPRTIYVGTSVIAGGAVTSSSATAGIGYATGAGGTVTQATSRTTGVTLDKICGSITLVSAAGSTSWQSFTVTNSTVAATDTVRIVQKSGTDKYQAFVTAVAAGSFEITYATTGGTTTEQPVFSFSVIKAVAA